VSGSVKSSTGSQVEMAGWVVVFIERDTGITRVADVNLGGNYEIAEVAIAQPQTILLLDPQYRFQSVLTLPSDNAGKLKHFFTMTGSIVPTLVHNGPTTTFVDTSNITVADDYSTDDDEDGIPDGLEESTIGIRLGSKFALAEASGIDTDKDGVINDIDVDIDGDGLINIVDHDDDGDGTPDIFDADENGDSIVDSLQVINDLYFSQFVEYFSVQTTQSVGEDDELSSALSFTTKLKPEMAAKSVKIKGPSTLFDEAKAVTIDIKTGDSGTKDWDGTLLDNGLSEDGSEGDNIFARKINLAEDIKPKASQMVFAQLELADGTTVQFPFTFPKVTTGAISGSYAASSRKITLSGTPFIGESLFVWNVHIFNSSGIKVFSSAPIEGETKNYTIPAGTFEAGETYQAVLHASSLARVPSAPTWTIKSQPIDLE
jgi:hypothetical protein